MSSGNFSPPTIAELVELLKTKETARDDSFEPTRQDSLITLIGAWTPWIKKLETHYTNQLAEQQAMKVRLDQITKLNRDDRLAAELIAAEEVQVTARQVKATEYLKAIAEAVISAYPRLEAEETSAPAPVVLQP